MSRCDDKLPAAPSVKAFLLTVALSLLSQSTMADNETLSFRRNSAGEIQAVVAGVLTNECGVRFGPPTSITIARDTITIISSYPPPPPCVVPIVPPRPYEAVANLGVLAGPSYSVTWTGPGLVVLSAQLSPASLIPTQVPTLGPYALTLMALCIGLAGVVMTSRHRLRD